MIIHSPIFSGSISQDPNNAYANLSGSFTGSFKGIGQFEGLEADSVAYDNVTNKPTLVSGSSQISYPDLSNIPSGIISSSAQLSEIFLDTLGDNVISGSSQVEFNEVNNNPFSQSASSVTVSKSIIPTSTNLDLGSSAVPFRDLYLSSASLYIDGQQVISTADGDLNITTDANQSLRIVEEGADTITLQTENGDITLVATGTGTIELNAPIQIQAGKQILSSDGNPIVFGEDISVQGNIIVLGAVDGVDLGALKTEFDTLEGKSLVSGSSQVSYPNLSNIPSGIVSGSSQITPLLPSGVVSGSSQVSYPNLSNIPSGIVSGSSQITPLLPVGTVSGSSQVSFTSIIDKPTLVSGSSQIDLTQTTNYSSGIKTRLDAEGVTSGSTHILALVSIDEDNMSSNSDTKLPTQQSVKAYVDSEITALISGSPATLDTLNELAAALGDDPNFATTISTTIGGKVSQSLQIISGNGLTGGGNLTTDRTLAVGGTADRISVSADAVDIAATYVGQSSITTVGTITTGTWNGTAIANGYLANSTISGISLGSNLETLSAGTGVTLSGGYNGSAAKTIAIGQSVGTGDTVQFAKVGVGGASDATYELKVTGDIGATGDIVAYVSSDERLKNNVEVISNPIEKVQSLRGVTWEWNELASDAAKQSPNVGVIAQEVEKVLPQLVHDRENGFKGVDYAKLTGLLIEAIKEQQKQIDDLKSRL